MRSLSRWKGSAGNSVSSHQSFSVFPDRKMFLLSYYVNPDVPERVYLLTDGEIDVTGTVVRTEPHTAYVRYVDSKIHGRYLICYNGRFYISMWSAHTWEESGNAPDLEQKVFDEVNSVYRPCVERVPPNGFTSAGIAEFSGYDTVPSGNLSCDARSAEVYCAPDNSTVVFLAAQHSSAETQESLHVYVLYYSLKD